MPEPERDPEPEIEPILAALVAPTRQEILDIESGINRDQLRDKRPKRWEKAYRTQLSTAAACLVSVVGTYPLDVVKNKMQVKEYKNFIDCFNRTYRSDGVRGLFSGFTAPLVSVTLVRMISMSVYQKSKYLYSDWIFHKTGLDPLVSANTPNEYPGLATLACFSAAGATAGFVVTFVSCPFELVKLSAQLATLMAKESASKHGGVVPLKGEGPDYRRAGSLGRAITITKHRGAFGLWTGLQLQLVRDTMGTAIFFATYETAKQAVNAYRGDTSPVSPFSVVAASALCGITSWAFIYPLDTAKNRYQKLCLGSAKGVPISLPKLLDRRIWINSSSYTGIGVNITRSTLSSIAFFSVFEGMKKYINALPEKRREVEDLT